MRSTCMHIHDLFVLVTEGLCNYTIKYKQGSRDMDVIKS